MVRGPNPSEFNPPNK